jgi:hypothetical protein
MLIGSSGITESPIGSMSTEICEKYYLLSALFKYLTIYTINSRIGNILIVKY